MPGTIVFKPIEANITHNTELLGKMDPYCLFHVGDQKIKGQVCKKGGKHPMWEDSVVVPISNQPICTVDIKDKDILLDDKIGTFEIDLREIESQGMIKKWYPIFHKDKPAGEILLEAVFNGDLSQGQSSNLGYGQQGLSNQGNLGYGQQGLNQTNLTSGQQGLSAQSNLIGGAPFAGSALAGGALVGSTLPTGTAPIYGNQGSMGSAPLSSGLSTGQPIGQSTGFPIGQSTGLAGQSTLAHGGHHHVLNESHFIDGYPRVDHKQQGIPHESHGVTPHNLPTSGLPDTYGNMGMGQGIPSAEQYAQEALMRGIDPLNTQALGVGGLSSGLGTAGLAGSQLPLGQNFTQSTTYPGTTATNIGGLGTHHHEQSYPAQQMPFGHGHHTPSDQLNPMHPGQNVIIEETYTSIESKGIPNELKQNLPGSQGNFRQF